MAGLNHRGSALYTMKTKTVYLFLFLILVLIVILIFKSRTHDSKESSQTQPVEQISPIQTQLNTFRLISNNASDQFGITDPIRLEFDQPVSNNLVYTIEPQIEVIISPGINSREIVIEPVDAWGFNLTYTLRISRSSTSITGQTLDKAYQFSFKTPPYSGI